MASSTSNQDLTICTTGTAHCGVTLGPTDICKLADMKPAPFENEAHTTKAENPTSMRTQIAGKQIITIQTRFGTPPTSLPVHLGINGGTKSGTYIRWARATSASGDVFAENNAVVRHTDPTEQNCANTVGIVIDTSLGKDAEVAKLKKLARCMVVELKVTCKHNGRAMVGGLLEVLQGDTLTLVATRKNATAEKGSTAYDTPICQPPPGGHAKTRFRVTRSACSWAGFLQKTAPSPFDGADTKELGTDWTGEEPKPPPAAKTHPTSASGMASDVTSAPFKPSINLPAGAGGKGIGEGKASVDEAWRAAQVQSERLRIEQNYNGQRPGVGESAFRHRNGPTVSGTGPAAQSAEVFAEQMRKQEEAARKAERQKVYQETRAKLDERRAAFEESASNARKIKAVVTSLEMAKTLWRCQPAEITIAATGCSGAKGGLVKVYPAGEFELDLMKLKDFLALWKRYRDYMEKFDELCALLKPDGKGFDFQIKLLEEPCVKFKWEYKECTKASVDGELKPHHVGMDWSGLIGFEQLVKFIASFTVSLLKAAGILGDLVAWALSKFDIRMDLVLEAELSIGFVLEFGKTEHRENKAMSLTAPVVAQFAVSIVLKAGTFASATFKITLAFKPVLQGVRMPKWYKVEFQTKETVISVTYEMVFKADIWGLRDGKKFGGNLIDPIKYGAAWVDPLPFLN